MAFFVKNGFWISSFLLVAAMIGTWFYATGNLQAEMDKRISALTSSNSKAKGIMNVEAEEGTRAHPNDQTEQGMQEKLDKLSVSVLAAWQKRYDSQQKIMQWPDEILPNVFIEEFNKYHPPELLPVEEIGDSVRMKNLLLLYKQQIPNQMKNICSVIQTKWAFQSELDEEAIKTEADSEDNTSEEAASGTDDGEAEGQAPEETQPAASMSDKETQNREIVRWSENNQNLWFNKLTNFLNRDDNAFTTKLPSPSQVYMLQQDLWLLEAMFHIVQVVNSVTDDDGNMKLVQANDLAPVKEIDHVVFGREALALLGSITESESSTEQTEGRGAPRGRGGRTPTGGGRGSTASDIHLAYLGNPAYHGRYVNKTFEPIESDKIRQVLASETLPADSLELVVAKRVPVRLAVHMDEREIPRFLAACANSPFAFEVWQVRVNRHDSNEVIKLRGSEGAAEGGGGRTPGGRGSGPSRGGLGRGGVQGTNGRAGSSGIAGGGGNGGGSRGSRKRESDVVLRSNYDVGVEFYGVVKIYNPPNKKLLMGEEAGATNP